MPSPTRCRAAVATASPISRRTSTSSTSRRIDANVFAAGNQAFQFIGTAAFYAAGQLNYYLSAGDTIISANTDNDAAAEFQIALNGYHQMIRADFVL